MEKGLIYTPREEGFWSFDLGNKILDLSDALIPAMTQEQSATYLSPKGFNTCTLPQFFLVGSKLHELKDSEGEVRETVESAHQFVKQGIRNNWLNTQTRISYSPAEQDIITHGYGRANPIVNGTNFVGQEDGSPEKVLSLESSLALTGKKPEEVNAIMSYLNGTSNYVRRLNSKPASVDDRVVRLVAMSDRFNLSCDRIPQLAFASFGVRLREKNKESSH